MSERLYLTYKGGWSIQFSRDKPLSDSSPQISCRAGSSESLNYSPFLSIASPDLWEPLGDGQYLVSGVEGGLSCSSLAVAIPRAALIFVQSTRPSKITLAINSPLIHKLETAPLTIVSPGYTTARLGRGHWTDILANLLERNLNLLTTQKRFYVLQGVVLSALTLCDLAGGVGCLGGVTSWDIGQARDIKATLRGETAELSKAIYKSPGQFTIQVGRRLLSTPKKNAVRRLAFVEFMGFCTNETVRLSYCLVENCLVSILGVVWQSGETVTLFPTTSQFQAPDIAVYYYPFQNSLGFQNIYILVSSGGAFDWYGHARGARRNIHSFERPYPRLPETMSLGKAIY
ncbi:hypothetical protein BDY19DRAFT_902283, partial [Irpex rosettiformis]